MAGVKIQKRHFGDMEANEKKENCLWTRQSEKGILASMWSKEPPEAPSASYLQSSLANVR